jgi:ribose transport system permease protein
LFGANREQSVDARLRSVTVDTSKGRCAEWTPGRGSLLTVSPLRIGLSVSAPVGADRVADDAAMGRSAQVVASALAGARFLPIWLAMCALLVVAALFASSTLDNASWSYILPYGTILAIAALGQMLVVMQAGIDLSTAGVISLCGNVLVGVSVGDSRGLAVAILVSLALGALVGLANGILVGIVRLNPLIVTLATGQIVLAYSSKYARENTISLQVPDSLSSWASRKPLGISAVFWAGLAIAIAVALVLRYTVVGRRFQAVGANPRAAWMAGLRVRSHVVFAYTAAGFLYGVAAVLLAAVRITIDPAFGASYLLAPIAAVVLAGAALSGGLASATSTWIAAIALTFLTEMLLIFGLSAALQYIVFGVAIIVGMLISGDRIASLLGRLLRKMEASAAAVSPEVTENTS